jgi:ATP-dependent helicase/nuclease subunit A
MNELELSVDKAASLPPDEPAREIIRGREGIAGPISADPVIVLDKNLVVRAGAGSGKTRSLVDRMVALVRSGIPARQIASITFTIKAAGELRVRFSEALGARIEKVKQLSAVCTEAEAPSWAQELEHLQAAERQMEHIFVGTVHAFCGRLLRERPFEAGLSPDFSHVDPGLVIAHRRRFWGGFVARSASRWIDRFEAVDLDPEDLFEFFSDCANNEDVGLDGLTLRPPLPDLRLAVEAVVTFVTEIVEQTVAVVNEDDMLQKVRAIHRFLQRQTLDTAPAKAKLLSQAARLGTASVTMNRWGARQSDLYVLAKQVKESIGGFVQEQVEPALAEWRDYVFFDAGQFVQEAVTEYSNTRRRRGEQTFDDLLWGARRMLVRSSENREHFARKFSHILVDEFQDTDPIQAEILLFLSSTNRDETNPWKCQPSPGSLFIVGDDKQSIYRFRRADVDVFHRFEKVLLANGGESVALTTNFRSDPRVCSFVNEALMPAFSDPLKPAGQAKWEDLVAFKSTPAGAPAHPVVRIAIPEETHKRRGDLVGKEAPLVAGAISQIVQNGCLKLDDGRESAFDQPVEYGDVMVLFRTATYMSTFVEALNAMEIPYSISGGKTLGKVKSLRLILDPLDAVLKQDSVTLLAFLRGPLCGVSDTELMDFKEAGGSLRMPLREGGTVVPGDALADGLHMVTDLQTRLGARAPAEAIEGWIRDYGVLAGLAVQAGGAGLAGSLIRILALVRAWDAIGMTWPEVIDELHRLSDGDIEAEQLTLDALEGKAVRLMTVHQAKGLEAKVVILADPHWARTPENDIYVDRSGREATLAAQVKNGRGDILAWTPLWKTRAVRDLELQQAEELRLAYVAGTRAEQLLLISYQSKVEGPWDPFAKAIWEAPAFLGGDAPGAVRPIPIDEVDRLEAEMLELEEQRARLREPSYRESTASEGGGDDTTFAPTGEGRGKSFGNLVHLLFESLVQNREKPLERSWVDRVAARHAANTIQTATRAQRSGDAARAAMAFMNSPVWASLIRAESVYAELPYTYADLVDGVETIHSGKIDLAYRLEGAWHVVDYKTDAISGADLIAKHGAQVMEYANALTLLAGAEEVHTAIWSTHNKARIPVTAEDLSAQALLAAAGSPVDLLEGGPEPGDPELPFLN